MDVSDFPLISILIPFVVAFFIGFIKDKYIKIKKIIVVLTALFSFIFTVLMIKSVIIDGKNEKTEKMQQKAQREEKRKKMREEIKVKQQELAEKNIKGVKKEAGKFKQFISRGNVVDMAVGVIIGGAFSKIVTRYACFEIG